MEERLVAFERRGTLEEPIEVKADEVLEAIAEGRDVHIEYADIQGSLDIREVEARLDRNDDDMPRIMSDARISNSTIHGNVHFSRAFFSGNAVFGGTSFTGYADFSGATISGYAYFGGATFTGNAHFGGACFNGNAGFGGASFKGNADFTRVSLSKDTDFGNVLMARPANFIGIHFHENTVLAGLKNDVLSPMVKRLTAGRKRLKERPVTNFLEFNTATVMNGASNPRFKRYVDDEQWIRSWRYSSRLRRGLFYIWEATSHCGRSTGLWASWSIFLTLVFAFVYWAFGDNSIAFNVARLNGVHQGFRASLYHSVMTFTTFGSGDIVPLTNWARLAVAAEVVLGYVMFAVLISILTNKLARRS